MTFNDWALVTRTGLRTSPDHALGSCIFGDTADCPRPSSAITSNRLSGVNAAGALVDTDGNVFSLGKPQESYDALFPDAAARIVAVLPVI